VSISISFQLILVKYFEGTVAISMAGVTNFIGLIICRFLLGAFEAGLFPGFIYFTSLWYPRKAQAIRLGFFWSFSALAGAFGGLLAFGIGQIKSSKLAQWQLIFIVSIFIQIFRFASSHFRSKVVPLSLWRFVVGFSCLIHLNEHDF
jgi:MFS family permease